MSQSKRHVRMTLEPIQQGIGDQLRVIQAHLDLEGVAYLKIVRTGPSTCAVIDVTAENTVRGDDQRYRMKDIKLWWERNAAEKFGEGSGGK